MFKHLSHFYFKYFASQEKSWNYFSQIIVKNKTTCVFILKEWEQSSHLCFDAQKYSQLLQISFLKNYHDLSHYLLDNKQFVYPFMDIPPGLATVHCIDSIMTNSLLKEDHAAWMGLMACHHPFHLLLLEKYYDCEVYHEITRKFFFHPDFQPLYMNKERRNRILFECPTDAHKMLRQFFLEMDLGGHADKKTTVRKI